MSAGDALPCSMCRHHRQNHSSSVALKPMFSRRTSSPRIVKPIEFSRVNWQLHHTATCCAAPFAPLSPESRRRNCQLLQTMPPSCGYALRLP
eukprot:3342110-Amphidinium_carterae.4